MRRRRVLYKGRKEGASFCNIPHAYLESEQYALLSPKAVKALLDLLVQFRGANNGDLSATWRLMQKRGWTSKDQLYKALNELLFRGWIICTRKGGRDRMMPTLYAVTFRAIDYCGGKLDSGILPATYPLHLWKHRGNAEMPRVNTRRVMKKLARPMGHTGPVDGTIVVPIKRA